MTYSKLMIKIEIIKTSSSYHSKTKMLWIGKTVNTCIITSIEVWGIQSKTSKSRVENKETQLIVYGTKSRNWHHSTMEKSTVSTLAQFSFSNVAKWKLGKVKVEAMLVSSDHSDRQGHNTLSLVESSHGYLTLPSWSLPCSQVRKNKL